MGKTTRVLHDGHEYLLLDERRRGTPRRITCMVRAGDPAFAGLTGTSVVATALGNWTPLGIWQATSCRPVTDEAGPWVETVCEVVDRYLVENKRHQARLRKRRYWQLTIDSQVVFCFSSALPHGLCLPVFSTRAAARAAAGGPYRVPAGGTVVSHPPGPKRLFESCDSPDPRLPGGERIDGSSGCCAVAVEDLAGFLGEMAREGFAGALLDETHPIYFCTDSSDKAHFLKLELSDGTEMKESLLESDGNWRPYEGEPDIELFLDQDSCDATMVELLGDIPFHGYTPDLDFYALYPSGSREPLVVAANEEGIDSGARYLPLFHEVVSAEEFVKFHDVVDHELRRVSDIPGLLGLAARQGTVVRLQPETHRARAAALWLHDGEIILDSFSGFWCSTDGGRTYNKATQQTDRS